MIQTLNQSPPQIPTAFPQFSAPQATTPESPAPSPTDRVTLSAAEPVQTASLPSFASPAPAPPGLDVNPRSAEQIHRMQVAHPVYNPGGDADPDNANCGPTALTMALDRAGVPLRGSSVQEQIDATRQMMFRQDPKRDGLNPDGSRSEVEHARDTRFPDLERGAREAGARTRFTGSTEEIQQALGQGNPVIVRGNPMAEGSYGRRAGVDAEAHFATLSGYDRESRRYTLNDPLHPGPLQISEAELRAFQRDPRRPRTEGFGLVVMGPER